MTRFEKASVRASAYAAVLVVVLVAAFLVGRLVGPVDVTDDPAHPSDDGHGAGATGPGPRLPFSATFTVSVEVADEH